MAELHTQNEGLDSLVDISALLDKLAQDQGITWTTLDPNLRVEGAISTGLLSIDLITGGGFAPGRFANLVGPTGAGKSTFVYHTVKAAVDKGTRASIFDHESAFDPTYLRNLGINVDQWLGARNKKGTFDINPSLWYTQGSTAEATFRLMNMIMKNLPDKIMMKDGEESRYFLVSPEYTNFKRSWKAINEGLKKGLVSEVDSFTPQFIFVIDSLKSMLPEARDEDPDKDPIAILARCFGNAFPLIKSYIGRKNCLLITTNHLTLNPMAMFKDPETEPGGSAVQFYPDFRMRVETKRTKKGMDVERCISGEGEDRYFHGNAKILKNKAGPSFREMGYRIWIDSAGTPGMGICPVYDTYQFLTHCGFMVETKNDYHIDLEGYKGDIGWEKFKELVLDEKEGTKLRNLCFDMIRNGDAIDRYYEYLKNNPDTVKNKAKGDEDEEEEEDDDDEEEDSGEVEI